MGPQYYIDRLDDKGRNAPHQIGSRFLGNGKSNTIRASSALDILKILGIGYVIGFDSVIKEWICYREGYPNLSTYNENPAEAIAEMFIKINNQQK